MVPTKTGPRIRKVTDRVLRRTSYRREFGGESDGPVFEPTDDDPIAIGVVERWRPHDQDIDWMVFAHRRCFVDSLGPEASGLSDWRPRPLKRPDVPLAWALD